MADAVVIRNPEFEGFTQASWGWLLSLGVLMVVLGVVALAASMITTLVSILIIGFVIFAAGVTQIVYAFSARNWKGFTLHLLLAVLYGITAFMFIVQPGTSAVALTLLIAFFLIVGGLFRIISAAATRFAGWGFVLASGVISSILGAYILAQWPTASLFTLGVFVGVDLIFIGVYLTSFALTVRRVTRVEPQRFPGYA